MRSDDRIFAVVALCVVLAVAMFVAIQWLGSGITIDEPQRARVEVKKIEEPRSLRLEPTPSDASAIQFEDSDLDLLVRMAAAGLSSHPEFASWLVHDRLLRRFVMAVDAVAGGYSPRDEVEFLRPQRAFMVSEHEGSLLITPSTFRRYDGVVEAFASVDVEGAAELYGQLENRLEAVYAEVGWATSDFDSRLREAVDHLLEVEVPDGPYEVEQRAIVYAFAEDELEHLSDAQRQLLRMGPSNARQVQEVLRNLRLAIGWPEAAPSVMTAELDSPAPATAWPMLAASGEVALPEEVGAAVPVPIDREVLP